MESQDKGMECRGKYLPLGERTLVMGILNVTPDSFSDGGRYQDVGAAVAYAEAMVAAGADIIDVGAESTRPGYTPVSLQEEMDRLLPVLQELGSRISVPVSVDTYKPEVARAALEAGAHIINDQWGLKYDPELAGVAAAYGVPLILMHNQEGTAYRELMADILRSLQESIRVADFWGVPEAKIMVDPGIGFGKDTRQNLLVLKNLHRVQELGRPVVLGTSRKSVIGNTLGLPVNERLEGTLATVIWGVLHGADIVRVHDVQAVVRAVRMVEAIRDAG